MLPSDQGKSHPDANPSTADRERSLRVSEKEAAQAWRDIELAMADLREANGHLVLANLQSQALLKEVRRLHEEATEALEAKDDFFAQVSHELRTPLTSISGWADMLVIHPDPQTITQAARSIATSAALQARLINDLLDVSRVITQKFAIEKVELDLCSVVEASESAFAPLMAAKQITFLRSPHRSTIVEGDALRLRQVVDNLLSNALKFTNRGGIIRAALACEGEQAILEIRDNGEGIPSTFLPHVFDRHAQKEPSRHGGLGLGLAIVKHIVDMHGGTVTAESEGEGTGSTFILRIPLLPPA